MNAPTSPDGHELTVLGKRPWTVNQERKRGAYYERAEITRWWREMFKIAAIQASIPSFQCIELTVTPILPDKKLQDTGACFPTAKAAIDGLVDAGIIKDDAPTYVPTIIFKAPIVIKGKSGLRVLISPVNVLDLVVEEPSQS